MNIVYIVSFPLDENHGHKGATKEKIQALKNNGHSVDVLSLAAIKTRFLLPFFLLRLEFASLLKVAQCRKDTIIINRGYVGLMAIMVARGRKIFVAREVHADLVEESKLIASGLRKYAIRFAGYYCRLLDRMASCLIFNHPLIEKFYVEKINKNVDGFWCYNGVNKEKISSNAESNSSSKLKGQTKPFFIFVGNVSVWHGLDKAFELYYSDPLIYENYEFVVIGPVLDESLLRKYENSDIKFKGKMENKEVQKWISKSEICFLPVNNVRVSPGSPLKLYEYLAHGKPVITQEKVLGYADVVEHFNAGVSIDFDDIDDAKKKFVEFLGKISEFNSREISKRVLSECTWEAVVSYWLDEINKRRF